MRGWWFWLWPILLGPCLVVGVLPFAYIYEQQIAWPAYRDAYACAPTGETRREPRRFRRDAVTVKWLCSDGVWFWR